MKSEAQAAFEAAKEQAEAARELFRSQGQPNNIQVVMPPPTDGERAVHRAEKVAYFMSGILIGLVVLAVNMGSDIRENRREQQRTQDYLNMLWRTYPETRETALKAKEESKK